MTVPQDYPDRPVAVIGAGTLGRRIALMFATRGGLVRINARRAEHGAAAVDSSSSRSAASRARTPGGGRAAGPNTSRAWRTPLRVHGW